MLNSGIKKEQCVHYWVIDSPDGRTSSGKCKLCGLVREFSNYWDDLSNERNPAPEKTSVSYDNSVSSEEKTESLK